MKAKELVKDKFWIVEEQGKKVGTLSKKDSNTYLLVDKDTGEEIELSNRDITEKYGDDFFEKIEKCLTSRGAKAQLCCTALTPHPTSHNHFY